MDSKHFTAFYQKHVKRVYRFLYYRVGGKKEFAEDMTQDVFMKALNAFDRYDPALSDTSWIITIARNHLINSLQKERPSVNIEEVESIAWEKGEAFRTMSRTHERLRLLDAMTHLPVEDARLVRMKHLEGWSYEDLAVELGKNAGTLRVQAHRALKAMKAHLKQNPGIPVSTIEPALTDEPEPEAGEAI